MQTNNSLPVLAVLRAPLARSKGFTLIEVMVALVVVAVALPALLTALYGQVDGTAHLRDKTIAQFVAGNRLAEARLRSRRHGAALRGEQSGTDTLAGREWHWWVESRPTEIPDFHRLEIRVAAAPDGRAAPLATLIAFAAAPFQPGPNQEPSDGNN